MASQPSKAEALASSVHDLFSLPEIYLEVKRLVDDPDSSQIELANVLGHDPGLTARLLRLVNSAFFKLPRNVDTVSRAVSILGMQQIHDLVLATSVTKAFSGMSAGAMDLERYWRRSVHCGVLAHVIAAHCKLLERERLFVAGLLHDVGHLVMYQQLPDLAESALAQAAQENRPLFVVERELLGFDFAEVGAALIQHWKLPGSLREVIRSHIEPTPAAAHALEVAIVHIASGHTDHRHDPQSETATAAWHLTGLDQDKLGPLQEAANDRLSTIGEIFLSSHRRGG